MDRGSDEPIPPVHLSPEEQEFVRRQVDSGMYRSAQEVVSEGLRRMREMDEFIAANKDEISRMIEEGAREAERGELLDGEQVLRDLDARNRARLDERAKKRA